MPKRPVHQFEVIGSVVIEQRGQKRDVRFTGEDPGAASVVANALAQYYSKDQGPVYGPVYRVISEAEKLDEFTAAVKKLREAIPLSSIAGTPLAKATAACVRAIGTDLLPARLDGLDQALERHPTTIERVAIDLLVHSLRRDLPRGQWNLATHSLEFLTGYLVRSNPTPLRLVRA
jgi:hypothetical protein